MVQVNDTNVFIHFVWYFIHYDETASDCMVTTFLAAFFFLLFLTLVFNSTSSHQNATFSPSIKWFCCRSDLHSCTIITEILNDLIFQGSWVLLHNAHNTPRLLAALDSFMNETKSVDPEFRLWVSLIPSPEIPSSLLQTAVKLVADSPLVRLS